MMSSLASPPESSKRASTSADLQHCVSQFRLLQLAAREPEVGQEAVWIGSLLHDDDGTTVRLVRQFSPLNKYSADECLSGAARHTPTTQQHAEVWFLILILLADSEM